MTLGDLKVKNDSDWEDILYDIVNSSSNTFTYGGKTYTVLAKDMPLVKKAETFIYHPKFVPFFRDVVSFSIGICPVETPKKKLIHLTDITHNAVTLLYVIILYGNDHEQFVYNGSTYKFNRYKNDDIERIMRQRIGEFLFDKPHDFSDPVELVDLFHLANEVFCEEVE